jgi:DNA-binding beta-propeller fold protein YncE
VKPLFHFLFAVLAFASTGFAAMNGPTGLAVDASGNLYVSNFNANTVQVYNPAHKLIRTIRNGVNQPYGLAVDGLGFLRVANFGAGTVTSYDSTGKLSDTLTGLVNPILLAVDGLSDVWVVDHTLNTLSAWDLYDNQLYSFTATGDPNSVYYGVAEHACWLR